MSDPASNPSQSATSVAATETSPPGEVGRAWGFLGGTAVVLLMAAAVAGGLWASRREAARRFVQYPAPAALELADFQLTDRSGRKVQRAELVGKFLVVNLVFTSCGTTCLQVSQRMAEIQRLVADRSDVQLLSVTIDPRTDTPAVLQKFGERLGALTNRWLLLTGEAAALDALISASWWPGFAAEGGNLTAGIQASTRIALTDPRGRLVGYFDGFDRATPEAVVQAIEALPGRSEGQR